MGQRICSENGCDAPHLAKGLCRRHYDARRDLIHMRKLARRYYVVHGEALRERRRQRYWANRDQQRAVNRRSAQKHRTKRNAREKSWRHANPDRVREYGRRYSATKKVAGHVGQISPTLVAAKFAYWGWRCWMCGGIPTDADHVKPLSKGGSHLLANLRPACRSCNSTKNDQWPYPVMHLA